MITRLPVFLAWCAAYSLPALGADNGPSNPPQTMAPYQVKTSRMGLAGLTLNIDIPGNSTSTAPANHIRKISIVSVLAGSPAAREGIRPKDNIVQIEGRAVTDLSLPDLQGILGAKNPGDSIRLGILPAKGALREVSLTIALPSAAPPHS